MKRRENRSAAKEQPAEPSSNGEPETWTHVLHLAVVENARNELAPRNSELDR